MHIIQPMIKALRNNNISEIMKYEDISINLEDIAIGYKQDIELAGRIKESFIERSKTVELRRKNTVENLMIDLEAINIFDALDNITVKKLAEKIVSKLPVNEEYSTIKMEVLKEAIGLNDKKKREKTTLNKADKNENKILMHYL
ncbi:hypothetical protein GCM10008908_18440 [Clostridium subterminale]|uniref:Uncharacterized protein n=2 Tax=Clostridium subterminale TaxID=1550 RepID=A0ABN1KNW8_CLOSU